MASTLGEAQTIISKGTDMREYEAILLGTWLREEHLEDLKYVKERDFTESDLIKALKSGKTMLDIGTELKNIPQLARLTLVPTETLYKQAFAKLMDYQVKRDIANMSDIKSIKDKLDYLEKVSFEGAVESKDSALALLKDLNERATMKVVEWNGIPTLNRLTNGIKRKELTSIAARPSVGKSAFALQIAYGAWKQGEKVLYFPLEMSTTQSFGRLLVMENFLTAKELQTGKRQDEKKFQKGIDHISEMEKSGRFKVYEGEGRIETIETTIKREKPFLVVIDQLTQMRASVPFKDIRLQFSYMTSNLKRIAMQENVAIIILCQINRSADNIKPTMANLKESGSIEEDSDNVILLHRFTKEDFERHNQSYEPYEKWGNRPMNLNLAKQRDGDTADFSIIFKPEKMKFYEVRDE